MIVFLRQEKSLLNPVFPYLEASGEFSMAAFGEDRIPMGELWVDGCFDLFVPADLPQVYRFFSEVHRTLEKWKAGKIRLLLPPLIETSEPQIRKFSLLLEHFSSYFQRAFDAQPLTVPPLLEQPSLHPALQIIQAVREKTELPLLWGGDASFRVMKTRHCAELFLAPLPAEARSLAGRACTLAEVEEAAVMLWGRSKIHFENAYSIQETLPEAEPFGEEDEPLERLLFSLIS